MLTYFLKETAKSELVKNRDDRNTDKNSSEENAVISSEENKVNSADDDLDTSSGKTKSIKENANSGKENTSNQENSSEEGKNNQPYTETDKSSEENINSTKEPEDSEKKDEDSEKKDEDKIKSSVNNMKNRQYTKCLWTGNQERYEGTINKTKSGHFCQNWYTNKKEKEKVFPFSSFPSRL